MSDKPTHRLVRRPKMTGRYVADYMAGSERARRTIVRDCKYRPIARLIQHERAKSAISGFILEGGADCGRLTQRAISLRSAIADTDHDRQVLDNNADYIDAFVAAFPVMNLPIADLVPLTGEALFSLSGVEVNNDARFGLQRITRTNRVKTGLATLRYAKGKPLPAEVGLWQSALLYGYQLQIDERESAEPETALCITIDAFTGSVHTAPSDALSRFRNIEAALISIAERWNSIAPPNGAIIA